MTCCFGPTYQITYILYHLLYYTNGWEAKERDKIGLRNSHQAYILNDLRALHKELPLKCYTTSQLGITLENKPLMQSCHYSYELKHSLPEKGGRIMNLRKQKKLKMLRKHLKLSFIRALPQGSMNSNQLLVRKDAPASQAA